MSERVMEIVAYIVDAMQSNLDETILGNIESLSQLLMEQGYTENEINSAFSWLIDMMPTTVESDNPIEQALPEQQDHTWYHLDKSAFSPAAYNYIVQLHELDIVGEAEIEQILDHSLKSGKHGISISEIKALVASLILNADQIVDGSFFVFNRNYQVH